jgi:hypothetical protein
MSEKTDKIKANEVIWRLKVYRLQQLHEVARILQEGFRFSDKRTQYLMEKTSQGIARNPKELTTGLKECRACELEVCHGMGSAFVLEL